LLFKGNRMMLKPIEPSNPGLDDVHIRSRTTSARTLEGNVSAPVAGKIARE